MFKTRQDKTRQDKTRQDKTRQYDVGRLLLVKSHLAFLIVSIVCLAALVSVQTGARADSRDAKTVGLAKLPEGSPNLIELGRSRVSCCGAKEEVSAIDRALAPEADTYKLTATYYSLRDNLTTTLMLNNKGVEPLLATPTIYSLAGTRLNIAPITVPATSYIDVDMHQLLAGVADEFKEGSMKIAYEGGNLQLGAQIKLIDPAHELIWAEQFVYTTKFVSDRLENVWWLPYENSKTRVVVSNTSSGTVEATIAVDGTSPQRVSPVQISLAPWETRVLDILDDLVGHPNGEIHEKGGISITHTGAPGAVLARMFVAKPNKGYSSTNSFVDPDATVSQRWHGNGLRFRNLNGAKLTPVVVARNNGNQSSNVSGRIIYTEQNGDVITIDLPQKAIAAGKTKAFELDSLVDDLPNSVEYGGIELNYDTPKGSITTSVQSVSQNGNHVFQVPMMDPENMPVSAGGFPWKADGDFRTIVYIKNETDVERKYTASLTYSGGQYSFGLHPLKPHEIFELDFRKIRDEQIPDVNGKLIPLGVHSGQIAWSARGQETRVLSGRSEQISVSDGIASTYACYSCCLHLFDSGWIEPYGGGFDDGVILLGNSESYSAMERYYTCNSQLLDPTPANADWSSYSTSVATVSAGSVYGGGEGSTTIEAAWYTDENNGYNGDCNSPYSQYFSTTTSVSVIANPGVTSVSFEVIQSGSPAIDTNPNTGGGERVFPDDNTGDDHSPGQGPDRATIRVNAQISPAVSGRTVYFGNYDLDDSSTDPDVDPSGTSANDNIGGAGALSASSATTNPQGIATVNFTVTKQPGDNFAIAATADAGGLDGVYIDGTDLRRSGGALISSSCGATTPFCRSQMLTVWRRAHVEIDSMTTVTGNVSSGTIATGGSVNGGGTASITVSPSGGGTLTNGQYENGRLVLNSQSLAVTNNTGNGLTVTNCSGCSTVTWPNNAQFSLYDDDDFNDDDDTNRNGDTGVDVPDLRNVTYALDLVTENSSSEATNRFASAYVRLHYVQAEDTRDNNNFAANLAGMTVQDRRDLINAAWDTTTTNTTDDYWSVYLLSAYQGDAPEDEDPASEGDPLQGVVDAVTGLNGGEGSGAMVFLEVHRPTEIANYSANPPNWYSLSVTVAHELAHLFSCRHEDLGLMDNNPATGTTFLTGDSIRRIRELPHP